ncbi:MAG: NfeD family protein [Bacteroidales bacterium]|jgi:membrane-bound ClpP family serine protease|nr:NfeD family protein [Bacteroidales bacterium]
MDLIFILLFLVAGLALIVLELIAIPGTSIAGLSGLAMLIYGIYRVFIEYGATWGIISLLVGVVACTILLTYSLRSKTWKRFALNKSIDGKANQIKEELFHIGDKGVSITRLAYGGKAQINGQIIEVFTTTDFVDPKTPIEIERIEDNKIFVRPLVKED